jgi:hypothetical protein
MAVLLLCVFDHDGIHVQLRADGIACPGAWRKREAAVP